jgi:hypothetical protein
MLLFRSEEAIDGWCGENGVQRGAVVPVDPLQRLAIPWYGDRLDPGWRPRTSEQSQRILTGAGLTGDFWRLT